MRAKVVGSFLVAAASSPARLLRFAERGTQPDAGFGSTAPRESSEVPAVFTTQQPTRTLVTQLLLVLAVACGRTEPLVETIALVHDAGSADAGRADAGATDAGRDAGLVDAGIPTSCANTPGPQTAQRCSQTLRVLSVSRSMPSCFVDVRMNVGDEGILEWDCGTTMGRAEVRFPRARFTGVVTGDLLEVCFGSEFDWTDGCRWTSAQALRGPLTAGATLRLTYSEAPRPGQLGCVVPCSASGEVINLGP